MLFCLLSSTCDFETHVGGKTSIVKPLSRYLFTCPRHNCLETGVCTSQADLNTAYLSSLQSSKDHCGAVFFKMTAHLFAQVFLALISLASASTTTSTSYFSTSVPTFPSCLQPNVSWAVEVFFSKVTKSIPF